MVADISSNSSAAPPKKRRENIVAKFNAAINGALENVFEALGRFVGRRPVVVIAVALIVGVALASGRTRLEVEERGEKLWVPDDNQSQENNEFVSKHYPAAAAAEVIYLQRADGGDVITPEAFDLALSIHNDIVSLLWKNTEDENDPSAAKKVSYLPETQRLADVCLNTQGKEGGDDVLDCRMINPLELFGYNSAAWEDKSSLTATLNSPASWNQTLTESGFVLEEVLGGLETSAPGEVSGAQVLALTYFLARNRTLTDSKEQKEDEPLLGWEKEFLDKLEVLDQQDAEWNILRAAGRSPDDEFGGTVLDDLTMLNVAVAAIGIFTYLAISDWQDGFIGSRFLLTVWGLLCIGLAYFTCEGIAGYLGLFYSDLVLILPFIMLGVGVDGMFVLQGALDATNSQGSLEDRMGEVMRTAGLSVAAASLTNFGAFMIGSNTSLPALSSFSMYAAIGILFNLLLQITLFSGIMVLDKKRQECGRRWDVLMCVRRPGSIRPGYFFGAFGPATEGSGREWAMKWVAKQYNKLTVKVAVVVLWIGLLAAGIYGTSQMRVDADVNDFIPEGSYLREFIDTTKEQFGETGTTVNLYWVNDVEGGAPLDFTDPEVQLQMDVSLELFRANEYVVPDTMSSWWEALKGNRTAPVDNFYESLRELIATSEGRQYIGQLAFEDGNINNNLIAARSSFQWRYIEDTNEQIFALDSMRATTEKIPAPLGTRVFAFSPEFLNIEQYKSIGREAVMNIGLGFLMIGVVVLFLVANPVAAVLTFVCVVSAILELVGFMYFRGTYIDSISVIFIVISLGLAVDYSVHVAHGYLATREEDPSLRLQKTLGQTGAAVVNGMLSTLIAALCLSGSKSYVFITFFFALLIIVLCGAFQGLVVLPVLLDIFRPAFNAEVRTSADGQFVSRKPEGALDDSSNPISGTQV